MNWIKKNWSFLVLVLVTGLWLNQCNKDPEVIEIPVEVEVEVPIIKKEFDTIVQPIPKTKIERVIDSTLYKEYIKLKDSIQRDSAYKKAIEINEYNQIFDDSIQTIEVYTKTQGKILEQSLQYETKPRTITFLDTLEIKKKGSFNIGGGVGLPLADPINNLPVIKAELMLISKKGNTFSISYDTQGTVWATKTFKIF